VALSALGAGAASVEMTLDGKAQEQGVLRLGRERGESPYEQLTLSVRRARYHGTSVAGEPAAPGACLGAFDADGDGVADDVGWTLRDVVELRTRVLFRFFVEAPDPGPALLLEAGPDASSAESFAWLNTVLDAIDLGDAAAVEALRSAGSYTYSNATGHVARTVGFSGALPARYEGPRFDAESGPEAVRRTLEVRVDRIEMK
jgi:hypothetical protein